jgi:hypothetical protein
LLRTKKRHKLLFFEAAVFIVCLALSVFSATGRSQAAGTFKLPCIISTYGPVWDGELAFGLFQTNPASGPTGSYLIVVQTNGSIEYMRQTTSTGQEDVSYYVAKNFAQNTLLFDGEPYLGGASTEPIAATHIWDYVSNKTQDFPGVEGHHDVEYNPINNTFLTLQNYVATVNNNQILFDKIVEFDANGTVLWTWDTQDYIPLSEADPFNLTATLNGETVVDFAHANALEWDYNNSVIYLNLRHTNTFYKIDQNTGNIIWACGQLGNFTLVDSNGNEVTSLWYHSHGTRQVAPDVFAMFDNDFDNITNPDDCHSRLLEVTLDEQTMTARETWSWEAPISYWSPYWGDTIRLPNGDRMGVFGTPSHEFTQNQAYNFNDSGAVIVEVNPQGQVVRTYTFPVGWGIYRVQQITYPTVSGVTPTPTASSASNPTTQPTAAPMDSSVTVEIIAAAIVVIALVVAVGVYLKMKHANLENAD